MSRVFALAGLLRYRRLREDQAAASLAGARRAVQAAADALLHEQDRLDGTSVEVCSAAALQAVAAARTAARARLTELGAVEVRGRTELHRSQLEFNAARSRTLALEKLSDRHAQSEAVEELRQEQLVLDELAGTAWQNRSTDQNQHEGKRR